MIKPKSTIIQYNLNTGNDYSFHIHSDNSIDFLENLGNGWRIIARVDPLPGYSAYLQQEGARESMISTYGGGSLDAVLSQLSREITLNNDRSCPIFTWEPPVTGY